jgi:hypothetical protein
VQNNAPGPQLSQPSTARSNEDKAQELLQLHREIQSTTADDTSLLDHALHQAHVAKGKLEDIIASRVNDVDHPLSQALFRPNDRDETLKRKKGFLERR